MSVTRPNARTCVWLASALVCAGHYWLRAQPFPRRTAVGVETRLFGIGAATLALEESPSGRRNAAVLSVNPPALNPAPPAKLRDWPGWLYAHTLIRLNAGPRGSRPALNPVPYEGTWLLEGDRLRYRWRLSGRWMGNHHLWGTNANERLGPPGNWLLELATGRTYRGEVATAKAIDLEGDDDIEDVTFYPEAGTGSIPLAPALDDFSVETLDPAIAYKLEGCEGFLCSSNYNSLTADLFAATDREPYRSLVLSPRSALVAVSRYERTIFLLKSDGVWRLDLRKPVGELLREVTVPELPLEGVGR